MNFRRILLASAAPLSSGVENYRIWKMACTTFAAPFSAAATRVKADLCDGASASAEEAKMASSQREKRKIYAKLRTLTGETLDLIMREEEKKGVCVTQKDLVRWGKRLQKDGKHENAYEIFRWMETRNMIFSPSELAVYVDLIAKVKNLDAAQHYFDKVDPTFNNMDPHAKNLPAFEKLLELIDEAFKNSRIKRYSAPVQKL